MGYAFRTYWEDMQSDGVTFILYGSVILINALVTADGLMDAVRFLTK